MYSILNRAEHHLQLAEQWLERYRVSPGMVCKHLVEHHISLARDLTAYYRDIEKDMN